MKIFFITGKPACGKDTQADFLAKRFRAQRVTVSDVAKAFFRRTKLRKLHVDGVTIDVQHQKELFRRGDLFASRFVIYLIRERVLQSIRKHESIVVSGSPRRALEARVYLDIFHQYCQLGEYYFIHPKISDREAIRRSLLRHRVDNLDRLKIIKERLTIFRKEVSPGIAYLKRQGALIDISGQGTPRQVFQRILREIHRRDSI